MGRVDAVLDALSVTAARRWYVLAFLAAFLFAALRDLGTRRTVALAAIGWVVAWASQVPSIRWGVPYGRYEYLWQPAEPSGLDPREPALLGVPLFTDLSYVFLAYAALALARHLLGPAAARHPATPAVAAVLFVALDVVIDPVALRGEEWFLGKIYRYPGGGSHFGVPLTNYAGWLLVGLATQYLYFAVEPRLGPAPARASPLPGTALYFAVCAFNIGVALWIGTTEIAFAGAAIAAPLAALAAARAATASSP